MQDCDHENQSEREITREVSGHVFFAKTLICTNCGAELWTESLSTEFNKWINGLQVRPRIQFKMSHKADQCLDQILSRFPGSNKAIIVRAMIAVYIDALKQGPSTNDIFNQIFDSKYFQTFLEDGETRMFNTDVKPFFYFDIQSWGKLFSLKPNELAWEAFHLMMALCIAEDAPLREYWRNVILPQIETIIKAA